MKPTVLRRVAERDVEEAFGYYLKEAGSAVALDFVAAVDEAISHIAAYPASGSRRYGMLIDTPELRSWATGRFPYLIVYVEREITVDVLRVLHQERDIPAALQAQD